MGATSENIFQKDILNKEATLTLVLLSDSQTGHYFRPTSIPPAAPQGKVLTSCLRFCALWTAVTFCSEAVVSGPTGDLLRATHEVAWDYPHRQHPRTNPLNPSAPGAESRAWPNSPPPQPCDALGLAASLSSNVSDLHANLWKDISRAHACTHEHRCTHTRAYAHKCTRCSVTKKAKQACASGNSEVRISIYPSQGEKENSRERRETAMFKNVYIW